MSSFSLIVYLVSILKIHVNMCVQLHDFCCYYINNEDRKDFKKKEDAKIFWIL